MSDSRVKVLALDISTATGWALLEGSWPFCASNKVDLLRYGVVEVLQPLPEFGKYPYNYHKVSNWLASQFVEIWKKNDNPMYVVIEETNLGKNRLSQKILEFTHKATLSAFMSSSPAIEDIPEICYINTNEWRKTLGATLTNEEKRSNAKLARAKREAAKKGTPLDKKKLGIRGRFNAKHASVRWVNDTYGLSLKLKDNDIADAIAVGTAFLHGASICDGLDSFRGSKK